MGIYTRIDDGESVIDQLHGHQFGFESKVSQMPSRLANFMGRIVGMQSSCDSVSLCDALFCHEVRHAHDVCHTDDGV
eukprot:scaffold88800_cov20-Prasinocladus_malaysianus.AAC.1